MDYTFWFILIGLLFIATALVNTKIKRLPLTTSIIYLAIGFALGPTGVNMVRFDPLENSKILEIITEIAVLISLFTAGLKLRIPLSDKRWRTPVRLAFVSLAITVGLVTLTGTLVLGLPIGAAVLLGAILAPTDPVLASDVQLDDPFDEDRLRFGLTGEAGFNDGAAFPFVMLGLGLLGLHELGDFGWQWLLVDGIWAVGAGLGVGALLGTLTGHLVVWLRRERQEALGLDDFIALGLIALSYGAALLIHSYGFLAVFAAGLAVRRVEMRSSGDKPTEEIQQLAEVGKSDEVATHPEKAPAYMVQAVLNFNEQLERIGEVGVVIILGGMLSTTLFPLEALWLVMLLLLVMRPVSVALGLIGRPAEPISKVLMGWFGIRGIGSIYYLMYAINHELPQDLAHTLIGLTFAVVATSIILHGISVTPLVGLYEKRKPHRRAELESH